MKMRFCHNQLRAAGTGLMTVLLVLSMSIQALAGDAVITYDGNARDFVFSSKSSSAPDDLFDSFKDVMPGDTLTQKLTIKNDVSNNVKVKLYLRFAGAGENSADFLSQMRLTAKQQGSSPLFAAAANENTGLSDWVCLGTFYSGAKINLDLTLEVPLTLDNSFQNAAGKLKWEFMARELPVSPDDPRPPKVGDLAGIWIPAALYISSFVLFVLALKRRKAEKKS